MDAEQQRFAELSQRFGVQPRTIITLSESLQARDSFELVVSSDGPEEFWEMIDILPPSISCLVHRADLEVSSPFRDFTEDLLSPSLQTLYIAHSINSDHPITTAHEAFISHSIQSTVGALLSSSDIWKKFESNWNFGEYSFAETDLATMCEAYITGGAPWMICPVAEIRSAYISFYSAIKSSQQAKKQVLPKMNLFEIISGAEILSLSGVKVDNYSGNSDLHSELRRILLAVKEATQKTRCPPAPPTITEWAKSRSDFLASQMSLPMLQRTAFSATPNQMAARTGQPSTGVFDPFSLSELLLSCENGSALPLPFSECRSEFTIENKNIFCYNAFKKFVAKQLIDSGYEASIDSVIDVLTEVLIGDVGSYAKSAKVMGESQNGMSAEQSIASVLSKIV